MQAGRSTKKYCSDSCKQAAFYSRAAQQGVTLNDNEPFNDSDEENEANIEDGHEAAEECSRHAHERPFNVSFNVNANKNDDEKAVTKQSYSIPHSPMATALGWRASSRSSGRMSAGASCALLGCQPTAA